MDLSSIMPLINMLTQSMQNANAQPQSQPVSATPLSAEDQEYIDKNTSMFPKPFASPKSTNAQPTSTTPTNTTPTQPAPPQNHGASMDLNKVLPLLNSMSGNHVDTAQISKLMSGLNGGGDLGSIINLMSTFAKNNKPSSKNNSQIINNKNDNYIKA